MLVNPKILATDEYISNESKVISSRFALLENIMTVVGREDDPPGLVVTSHNFFAFSPQEGLCTKEAFINNYLVPTFNNKLLPKIPLVIGFDFLCGITNTYGGFSAVVAYFGVCGGQYQNSTSIWESWIEEGKCNDAAFFSQNYQRTFTYGGFHFGLLSCGDTLSACYGSLSAPTLPIVDVYLNLSHTSIRGHSSQQKNPPRLIQSRICRYCLGTRQLIREPTGSALIFGNPQILLRRWQTFVGGTVYRIDVLV